MTGGAVTSGAGHIARTPYFDPEAYAAAAGIVPAGRAAALAHYLARGVARGLAPHPLFHLPWYRSEHPGLGAGDPLVHYLASDRRTRTPHPLLDPDWYRERYPDVARSRVDPVLHYWLHGGRERRDPGPAFPVARYLARHHPTTP